MASGGEGAKPHGQEGSTPRLQNEVGKWRRLGGSQFPTREQPNQAEQLVQNRVVLESYQPVWHKDVGGRDNKHVKFPAQSYELGPSVQQCDT